jgi:hypothetical protein
VLFFVVVLTQAQTVIRGKVTDASTGDPIPFANVVIKGSSIGTPTNFDGYYEIRGDAPSDTILVSFIGYETKYKVYQKGIAQRIDFQLNPETQQLEDFVVYSGKVENPAFRIMRGVIDNKKINDKRRLPAYEFSSYTKIEVDVDNISDKLKEKKWMQEITGVLDSIESIAGEDGKPILPLFISESLSDIYFRSSPRLQKEFIKKTKITGVGIEDGSLIGQVIGTSFQEYNFYQNRMEIVDKEFASPLGNGWRLIYDYELKDSLYVGDDYCYLIDFEPKNDQELAFAGTMWITKAEFALKQIDATMQKTANLNFIEKIKIQQESIKTDEGAWLPKNSRILIDVAELTDGSAGFLAKFYSSNDSIRVTEPRPTRFYDRGIELAEDAREMSEEFWNQNRYEPLSDTEVNVIAMIDTLNNIRFVKTWTEIFKTIARGYVEVGKLDLGPWPVLISGNDVEGFRVRLGGRTNEHFSRKWQFNGFAAYGFGDERWKYGLGAKYIVDRKKWTTLTLNYRTDVDQFGVQVSPLTDVSEESAFIALTQIGNLVRPFRYERTQFEFARQFSRSFSGALQLKNQAYQPLFPFRYRTDINDANSQLGTNFTTSEFIVRLKYARDESFIINDNSRISLGTARWPIFLMSYTRGLKIPGGGDFDYHKLDFAISQKLRMGFWGNLRYQMSAGHIFNDVPYALLTSHIGNEQFVYTDLAFNTMNFFEFVSQSYAQIKLQHNFEGFVMNRIPLMKKLKWRLVGTGSVLFGNVSQNTLDAQVLFDESGNTLPQFDVLETTRPFAEVGVGIENIFRFFRVDYIRRLTYLEKPNIRKSDFKVSFQISL